MAPNHNTHHIVRNAVGTSGAKCDCPSWLHHWYRHSGGTRSTCTRLQCQNPAEVGAHVSITDGRAAPTLWIAPLCRTCNHVYNNVAMPLDSRTKLVLAANLYGCGR